MLALALAFVPTASAAGSGLFEKPFRWRDARGIVDVGSGRAAPSLVDLDADGQPDLVVGIDSTGQLLWYRNSGSAKAPRFVDPGHVAFPREPKIDLVPCFADLDGDGIPELVTSDSSEVRISHGQGQRVFDAPEKLRDRRGTIVRLPFASCMTVADWDGDGDPDLVFGSSGGELRLFKHLGLGASAPRFGTSGVLEVVDIDPVPRLGPTTQVADWDGDGVLDLLVGSNEGSVVCYRVDLVEGVRALQAGEVLLQPCYAEQPASLAKNAQTGALEPILTRSHLRAAPAACDWNGDGLMDLLVGDSFAAAEPEPQLTSDQVKQRDELRAQLEEVRKEAQAVKQDIEDLVENDLFALGLKPRPEPTRDGRVRVESESMRELRDALRHRRLAEEPRVFAFERRRDWLALELEPLTRRVQRHGYVWVYLRKAAALASAK